MRQATTVHGGGSGAVRGRIAGVLAMAALGAAACSDDEGGNASSAGSASGVSLSAGDGTGASDADDDDDDDDAADGTGGGLKLDVAPEDEGGVDDTGGLVDNCKVGGDIDGVGDCDEVAPPDSFDPVVQWEFWPEDGEIFSTVIPLVANLTDDNGDGEVDLCDTPDVVFVATAKFVQPAEPGHVFIIDGETGDLHRRIDVDVKQNATPAIADLDEDGVPEIITATFDGPSGSQLVALSPEGDVLWMSPSFQPRFHGSAMAVADVDNDGSPEVLYEDMLFSSTLELILDAEVNQIVAEAPAMNDLDGDGDMELIFGNVAVHHDGTPYYQTGLAVGFPAVADIDGDGLPEVIHTTSDGIHVLEHDGTLKYGPLRPTGVEAGGLNWSRPVTVHNFDQDPQPEFAMSSRDFYSVYEADGSVKWSAPVLDASGFAAGTAFDFLGDAQAEAMYADESTLFVFDGQGEPLLTTPRASHTLHEYPVVADIDDDGSAEILVVSEERMPTGPDGTYVIPPIQAIRDVEDRWIQARRIWNQHTYHVTNVREDATIPAVEPRHWEGLNTYRTNAQLDASGQPCQPPPEG